MKTLKFILIATALTLVACTPKVTEKVLKLTSPSPNSLNVNLDTKFPDSWLGKWKGELKISKGSGVAQTLPMSMSIEKTDKAGEYSWATIFGDKAETSKPYTLKTLDAANGLYLMDEENSIKLESYLFENKLVSWYVVQGTMILASFEKRDSQIVFEILAGKEDPISITGGKETGEDVIPEVKTMPFTVMQRAYLSRE